ncbi:MAG TPA: SusD/RagB family nutrient-binding outer membrane lipoprotein [Panacibacter sp.]|nr:SusD/RagB family nutrient-binding outer membrane lipoprotein [Panacibacter sp.]
MNFKKILMGILLISLLGACSKKLDSLLPDPNSPAPSTADVDLYLNYVQLSFSGFVNTASDYGSLLTRQQQLGGPTYQNAFSSQSFDGMWTTAYAEIIKNADALIPLAEDQKKYIQAGIAKIIKAYTIATMVDDFGDIPYTEINLGFENSNPHIDGGASVYAAALALIESALTDFTATGASSAPTNDLFYGGSATKWATFAKTLKLKLYMQQRLVDNTVESKITDLLNDGDLIDNSAEDFDFKYGTTIDAPDSRHPHYASNYTSTGAGEYINTYFLWAVCYEKGLLIDPRRRFYFYRQNTSYSNVNDQTCPCAFSTRPSYFPPEMPYCLPTLLVGGHGYWGRDHGDNTGIPPDGQYRTAWGIYPAGGEYDHSQAAKVTLEMGGKGAGIQPIWDASFTSFLKAEAAIVYPSTGLDARALLEAGMRTSIAKVLGYGKTVGVDVALLYPTFYPSQATIDAYVTKVLSLYDGAEDNDAKLNIIMREYLIAAWGNGIEPYNNYRRTGKPDNMQLTAYSSDPGYFIRSFYYPAVFVERNLNAPAQKTLGTTVSKVFWDNNPDDFIK